MEPRSRWIALLVVCAVMGGLRAQEVSVEDEYLRRLKVYETIQPVGSTPFGERLNLYTGDLTFSQTDVSLEGKDPQSRWSDSSPAWPRANHACNPT
jgi:hypothetical protein